MSYYEENKVMMTMKLVIFKNQQQNYETNKNERGT